MADGFKGKFKGMTPEQIKKKVARAAGRGVLKAGLELEKRIVTLLNQPGHGRLYTNRGKGKGDHRASSPGAPPATDFGRLKGSIRTVDESTGTRVKVRIGTDVKYAPWLEFGRRGVAARPFMRPALNLARSRMEALISAELRKL